MAFDESRLKELGVVLAEKVASQTTLADSFKIEDGVVQVDAAQKKAFDSTMAEIKDIQGLIDGLETLKKADQWGSAPTSDSAAMEADAQRKDAQSYAPRSQTIGQAFTESEEFKSLAGGANGLSMHVPFEVKTSDVTNGYNVKDVYSAMPSGTPGSFGTIQRDPIVLPPQRRERLRSLFPTRTTTAAVIEYFKLTGFANNAAPVAERDGTNTNFAAKPQSNLTFAGQQAPVRTLAHWEAAHRSVLADEPQLRSIIDNELLYGLRLEEDNQILNGDGTGENLQGILDAGSGIQRYNWSAGVVGPPADNRADAVRRAATLAFLSFYEPTGVVLHPNDWEDIDLQKDANGQYLMAVSIQNGAEARMWRMPVVDTPAMTEGKALVGAFGLGAQIYDRETSNIRISEQHADFFVRNAVVVLAEQRLALAIKRPDAFVEVTFDAAPA